MVLSLLVILGAAFPVAPLRYSGVAPADATYQLHHSIEYILLAPVARILDELSLLGVGQHVVVLLSVAAIGLVLAGLRASGRAPSSLRHRARCMGGDLALLVAAVFVVYFTGALVPRPMVSLRATHPDDVLVDFHSHTDESHDGRWRFDVEANRAWHAAAGFHAAYVTDHQTMDGWQALAARRALAVHPTDLSEASFLGLGGTRATAILLPGIETVVPGAHINLLGVTAAHAVLFAHRRNLDTVAFALVTARAGRPVALLTLPFDLTRLASRIPRLDAIEISDGSPKGISFARRHRSRILSLADSLGIPVVASSNNHGWGATAVAWTAIRIPGWSDLTPGSLDEAIRAALRRRPAIVGVAERRGLDAGSGAVMVALTLPRLVMHVWRIAAPVERAAFIAWIWGIWIILRGRDHRRRRRTVTQETVAA